MPFDDYYGAPSSGSIGPGQNPMPETLDQTSQAYGRDGRNLGSQPLGLTKIREIGAPSTIYDDNSGQPQMRGPVGAYGSNGVADPNAGAGWKQNIKKLAGIVGQATSGVSFGQNGAMNVGQQHPGAQQAGAVAGQAASPAGQGNDLITRAQALLKQGVISPAQFAQIIGAQHPGAQAAGAIAGGSAAPVGVNGVPLSPNGTPDYTNMAGQLAGSAAPPLGPTSPAWQN